jgi:hypothetical protein
MQAVVRFLSRWSRALTNRAFEAGWQAYEKGNYNAALRELLPLAKRGSGEAQAILGNMYHEAQGFSRDYIEAARWYRMASDQGHPSAQVNLATMYYEGQGVPQDYVEAARRFRLAAELGDPKAQFNLGVMYDQRIGGLEQSAEAMRWFLLAAEQGYADAQFNLGVMYGKGQSVSQNYVLAHMWLELAAASGDSEALKSRDAIGSMMTPEQMAEAQRLAQEFRPITRTQSALGIFRSEVGECCDAVRDRLGQERVLAMRATDLKFPDLATVVLDETSGASPAAIVKSARIRLGDIGRQVDLRVDAGRKASDALVQEMIGWLRWIEDLLDMGTILGADSENRALMGVHHALIRETEVTADQDLMGLLLRAHSLRVLLRTPRLRSRLNASRVEDRRS